MAGMKANIAKLMMGDLETCSAKAAPLFSSSASNSFRRFGKSPYIF
jgi:hypothetical protein